MRERLLAERQEHLSEAAEWTERYSTHMADSASDEPARELALSCLSAQADELHKIEAALVRIANGTYGICGRPAPAFLPRVYELCLGSKM